MHCVPQESKAGSNSWWPPEVAVAPDIILHAELFEGIEGFDGVGYLVPNECHVSDEAPERMVLRAASEEPTVSSSTPWLCGLN
jgi:hypothetical protein